MFQRGVVSLQWPGFEGCTQKSFACQLEQEKAGAYRKIVNVATLSSERLPLSTVEVLAMVLGHLHVQPFPCCVVLLSPTMAETLLQSVTREGRDDALTHIAYDRYG